MYGLCESLLLALRPLLRHVNRNVLERGFALVERPVKSLLFDCHMCGDCVLSSTGMACPMNCPKRVRNGPCGGVRADGTCELDATMPCVWNEAWTGLAQSGHQRRFLVPRRAAEESSRGRSAWAQIISEGSARAAPRSWPEMDAFSGQRESPYPPNHLEQALAAGRFVVTAELSPPDSADPRDVEDRARHFVSLVDAVNVPDGSGANCHMSSLASSLILRQMGLTPIMQYACRDRNRIALQGDILGAAALGIRNLLCLTGDGVTSGDQQGAMPVFDLDAVSLLRAAKAMRDESRFMSGRRLAVPPDLFLGAADNPFAPPFELRPLRLAKKIAAGAQFIQTQYCFDMERLEQYMKAVRSMNLHTRCHIIVGVGPLTSLKTALWMRRRVPGMHIPDQVIEGLRSSRDQAAAGQRLCIEHIRHITRIEGVAGVHVMAHQRESLVADIIREAFPALPSRR